MVTHGASCQTAPPAVPLIGVRSNNLPDLGLIYFQVEISV